MDPSDRILNCETWKGFFYIYELSRVQDFQIVGLKGQRDGHHGAQLVQGLEGGPHMEYTTRKGVWTEQIIKGS